MMLVIIFLVVIIVLVVAHELGHFFTAKWFGVRVDEFGVGYPPRAGKLFTWKETLFTLNWLPFGGFVKIYGEQGGNAEQSDSFVYQKKWKRASIVLAGIIANILLAMILYGASFAIGFLASPSDFPNATMLGPARVTVTEVLASSPASSAGLKEGDVITHLSAGKDSDAPATPEDLTGFIQSHGNVPVTISIVRGSTPETFVATPKTGVTGALPGIGVSITVAALVRLPFFRAFSLGITYALRELVATIVSIIQLFGSAFKGSGSLLANVSGPVGIAEFAGTALGLGFGSFLSFVALISINLAVINLLPFPALDGGRFILELFSSNGRSLISSRVVGWVNQIGFILLIVLMLYVTYHDIARLVT